MIDAIGRSVFQYYGIDWSVTLTVFLGIFLLSEKKRSGFLVGMLSAVLSLVFSVQIRSVAAGMTALVVFFLYLRGFVRWRTD